MSRHNKSYPLRVVLPGAQKKGRLATAFLSWFHNQCFMV
jgi:hypothetical protein